MWSSGPPGALCRTGFGGDSPAEEHGTGRGRQGEPHNWGLKGSVLGALGPGAGQGAEGAVGVPAFLNNGPGDSW